MKPTKGAAMLDHKSRPLLILLLGLPGSGKTTFAKNLARGTKAIHISSDGLRIAIWDMFKTSTPDERRKLNTIIYRSMDYITKKTLPAGYSTIIDRNANSLSVRQNMYKIAKEHGAIPLTVRIRVPRAISLKRVQTRNDDLSEQLQFKKKDAQSLIRRFDAELEEPVSDENTIEISGQDSFDAQYDIFERRLNEFA